MEWDDLRIALAIARARGLSGAGRALGLNHATVWRRLKSLEARLGVRLFDRRPEGYVATAAGEELRRAAEAMEEAADALDRRISGHDLRLTGIVRLSTLDSLAWSLLGPHLARFRRLHPGIVIEVSIGNALANLTRRDADIVLRATDSPPETLVGQRLGDMTMAAYGAPAYAAAKGSAALWSEHDWVAPDESMGHTPFARFVAREAPDRVVLRADSVLGLAAAAAAGLGATLLPCFLGDGDPRFVRLSPPLPELTHGLWLLTHEDLRSAARIRAVLDFLSAALRADRARLAGSDVRSGETASP
ncbi:MAG: LysR family transcriptional regulator [Alphaproteobacteria bacterium]|nr:LysR family transcriptional regulator [Alphaproteobacteria bacterium]